MEDRFATNAQGRGQNVRCVISAREVTSSISKKDCYLLVSDTHFEELYAKKPDSIRSFSWFKLTKIENNNDNLLISFGKLHLSFTSNNMGKLYLAISDILPHILQSTELKSAEFVPAKNVSVRQNGRGCLLRLQERSSALNTHISASVFSHMNRFVTFSETSANLSKLSDPMNSIQPVLDALTLYPGIKEIIVPSISRVDSFGKICNFVAEKSSVEHIEVEGSVTRNFDRFLHNIEGNQNIQLYGLSFSDSRMSARNLEMLASTIKEKNILSLGMKRAVSSDAMDFFYSSFLTNFVGQKLIYLNLDKTLNPNIKVVLETCPRLQMLSVAGCGLDISKVALMLTSKQAGGLRAINLSNNMCKAATPRSLHISATIQNIQINSVTWSEHTLPEFFQTLTHSIKQGLYLSAADADATTDEWIRLFSYLRQTKFTGLHSLVWSSNPVHNRLFDFLARNHDLVHLDLSGCFIQQEKEPMQSFANYISKSPNLRSLVIRGNSASYIGSFIPNILSSVESSKGIRYLDICGNRGGNASIDAVRTLINGRSQLEVVSFDGSEPESSNSLVDLLNSCTNSVTNAAVSYPQSDIDMLLRKKKISQEAIEKVKQNLMYETVKSSSPFDRPFHIFRDNPPPQFPTYLKEISVTQAQDNEDNISEMFTLDNIEVDPPEAEPKINYVPINPTPLSDKEPPTIDGDEAEPPTLHTLTEGTRKRKRGSSKKDDASQNDGTGNSKSGKRKKRSNKTIEKLDTLETTLNSIMPDSSANFSTSDLGDVDTLVVDSSTNDTKEESGVEEVKKKKHKEHKDQGSSFAASTSSAADGEDTKKKKRSRKRKHGSSSSPASSVAMSTRDDSFDWTMPVKYTFFDGMDKLWRHANLRYSLQTLHNDLHAMRPEKK